MATTTGKNGEITIGATAIASASSWSLEQTADPAESSVIGNEWRDFKPAMKGFSVTIEGFYDITDTAQGSLAIGTEVAFELFPAGNVSTEREYSGNGIVTAYSETGPFDNMVTFSATLQGTGTLTSTVVI
jgi:predicted secreted protein